MPRKTKPKARKQKPKAPKKKRPAEVLHAPRIYTCHLPNSFWTDHE